VPAADRLGSGSTMNSSSSPTVSSFGGPAITSSRHRHPGSSRRTVLMPWSASALLAVMLAASPAASQSLRAWGYVDFDSTLAQATDFVEIAAGKAHTVARRADGSVVAWGQNMHGQCKVPALPPGLRYVEVAAGGRHSVARRSDGSVVAW